MHKDVYSEQWSVTATVQHNVMDSKTKLVTSQYLAKKEQKIETQDMSCKMMRKE